MHHLDGERRAELCGKVAVGHPVDGVEADPVKAEPCRLQLPVGVVGGAGQGTAADGRHVQPSSAVREPSEISQQHHRIGHELVAEGNGLGPLQVGIARHDGGLVFLRLVAEDRGEAFGQRRDGVDLIPQVHAEIQRHLVVAAAGGVELFAHIAEALCQHRLHEHVDVLGLGVDGERAGREIVQDALQPVDELCGLVLGDDALCPQHGRAGHGAGNILLCHAAVKGDGGVKVVGKLRRLRLRPPCP